jgi:hypothetical protein
MVLRLARHELASGLGRGEEMDGRPTGLWLSGTTENCREEVISFDKHQSGAMQRLWRVRGGLS